MRKVINGSLAAAVLVVGALSGAQAVAEGLETGKKPVLQLAEGLETGKKPVLQFAEGLETGKKPVLQIVA